jgi:hypothetical protein
MWIDIIFVGIYLIFSPLPTYVQGCTFVVHYVPTFNIIDSPPNTYLFVYSLYTRIQCQLFNLHTSRHPQANCGQDFRDMESLRT